MASEGHRHARSHSHGRTRHDAGFTIPELLITVAIVGLVMAVLASTLTVLMRQESSSSGRLTNAHAEQTVGMWMPTDLASAQAVDSTPSARPCASPCASQAAAEGSNTVMLSWQTMVSPGSPPTMRTTNVSYRYIEREGAWMLNRVQCDRTTGGSWSCADRIVSRTMAAPPVGSAFTAGATYPTWAVGVAQPLDPIDPGTGTTVPADESRAKNATRVTLTVQGSGTDSGTAGGTKQIILTAGSAKLTNDLDPTSMDGAPTFANLRSRCGGNFGLVIDSSGSIGTQMSNIKDGLSTLVDTFRGTPVKIQLVDFDTYGRVVGGANSGKQPRWFDMLDEADLTTLKSGINQLVASGGTNWEEGFYRMFRNDDGSQQSVLPETVLFFTDGAPTYERLVMNSTSGPVNPPAKQGFPTSNGSAYSQEAFFRAAYIVNLYRDVTTKIIGVGVGPYVNTNQPWRVKNANGTQSTVSTPAMTVIARLVSGTDTAVPAARNASGAYTNAATATLYGLPDWNQFAKALEAVALAKCGGTLTLQTANGNDPFAYPVSYQNTAVKLANGQDALVNLTTVTTSASQPGATFDYSIPSGTSVTVDVMPASTSDLTGFRPVGWSCSARGAARPFTTIPIAGSQFTGIRVQVKVNEALSCKLQVTPA